MLLLEPIPALLAAATNQEPGVVYDNAPFQDDAEWDSVSVPDICLIVAGFRFCTKLY